MQCYGSVHGTNGPGSVTSYYDLQDLCPKNPADLIAFSSLSGVNGTLWHSSNYRDVTWSEINGVVSIDAKPVVTALGTDNIEKVADAAQWNIGTDPFEHPDLWLTSPLPRCPDSHRKMDPE